MISKNQIKFVRSLELKKNRQREGLFVAEGPKVVGDLMARFQPQMLVATSQWLAENARQATNSVVEVSDEELRKVSFLQHPQQVIGVFPIPSPLKAETMDFSSLTLALDGVQDPGNVGTIIRIADWFGIETIICSTDTADCFNPKVVQATMGSLARVNIVYIDLPSMLSQLPADVPFYGTFLDGNDLYSEELSTGGIIVMGNEGKGISPAVSAHINRRLLIPNFPKGRVTADSLNVAIATAITCAEFRRRGQ